MRRRRNGFGLVSVLLAMAIMLVLLSALLPSAFRIAQVNNETAAASQLAAINLAETQYFSRYGAFINPLPTGAIPSALATYNLALPVGCGNAGVLNAQQATAPPGYTATFTALAQATAFTCSTGSVSPVGVQGFSLNLDPSNNLQAQRHFFTCTGGTCDGLVHFSQGRAANASDPIYSVTAAGSTSGGGSGGTGTGTGVGSNGVVTIYSASTSSNSIAIGSEVLRPASIAGDSCKPVGSSGFVGVFVSLTGVNDDPCLPSSAADWFLSSGTAVWAAAPPPSQSGQVSNITVMPPGACVGAPSYPFCDVYNLNFPSAASITYTKASFSIATLPIVGVQASVINLNSGQTLQCSIGTNTTTCNAVGSFTVNPGDQIYVGGYFSGEAIPSESFAWISWSVSQ